jgi:hypothetical protein
MMRKIGCVRGHLERRDAERNIEGIRTQTALIFEQFSSLVRDGFLTAVILPRRNHSLEPA